MADAGASQRRALHTGITRTGQSFDPQGSNGESYFSTDLTQDAPDGNSTRVGLHSGITATGFAQANPYGPKNLRPESPNNQSGSRATGTFGAVNAGYDPPIGAHGQSYQQHNFGQGAASQGVTDRPSLNSKTPGPDRVLPPLTGNTIHFKMRARDPDCPGVVYRTWVVMGSPDFSAAQYVGARCGVSPLTEIVVVYLWMD